MKFRKRLMVISESSLGKIDLRSRRLDMGCGSGRWAKLVAPRVGS